MFKLVLLFVTVQTVLSASTGSTNQLTNGQFTQDLFTHVINDEEKSKSNLVFSPASIHTCLALAFFGAEDATANEMISGLHFSTSSKDVIASQFENMLNIARGPNSLIKLANKIYANKNFEIKQEFNAIAKKSFESEAESLDFSNSQNAVSKINNWVAEHTNNKIQDLVDESVIKSDTQMVLVNAIHFKGNWKHPLYTRNGEFFNEGATLKQTTLMHVENNFPYDDLEDLKATAVKMPYDESDLSLLLILPKDKTGYHEFEQKLKNVNLLDLVGNMKIEDVSITMPKFKIESKFSLNNVLQEMGMKTMFTDQAKFNFFESENNSKVGDVLHKAFIDVNESGTEAGAATGLTIVPASLNLRQKIFYADHPFFFAIVDDSNVYFNGHLINV